jgi:hypothetical protein
MIRRAPRSFNEYESEESPDRVSWYWLARKWWWACAAGLVLWQTAVGRPGIALLLLAGASALVLLPRRASPWWLTGLLAPPLGLVGLAGAFPALAGQSRGWRERATIAALGYWWLTLAGPLASHRLWLAVSALPARDAWESSLRTSAVNVVYPALSLSVLAGCLAWALGASVLPWVVRGRNVWADLVLAAIWATALAAAQPLIDSALRSATAQSAPHGLVASAAVGWMLAIAARAFRGPL